MAVTPSLAGGWGGPVRSQQGEASRLEPESLPNWLWGDTKEKTVTRQKARGQTHVPRDTGGGGGERTEQLLSPPPPSPMLATPSQKLKKKKSPRLEVRVNILIVFTPWVAFREGDWISNEWKKGRRMKGGS